ncbi:MAG: acyl-[acyl-carrier-protein] thioesterase [Mangrovibacterium sp.]
MEKYRQQIRIQSHHTNQYGKASLCSLFQHMLESAWAHAQVMDWGYKQLHNKNMFWVLSRMYMEVEEYPGWQDEIMLRTWSAGTDGMYAYREFILEDKRGKVLLRANTAWLILDIVSKKIILLRNYRKTFPRCSTKQVCREPERLRPGKPEGTLNYSPVRFSELDINRHFNSVRALERVLDRFGIEFLNDHEPATLEVNYLKEGLAGDSLAVFTQNSGAGATEADLFRQKDQACLSSYKILWRKRIS